MESIDMSNKIFKIMNIIASICSITALILCLTGCGQKEVVAVNVQTENDGGISQAINNKILGESAMIKIGNELWYDSTTGIVYWWNGYIYSANCATTPTPYYSSNGLLYRYIPETNTLEEVKPSDLLYAD